MMSFKMGLLIVFLIICQADAENDDIQGIEVVPTTPLAAAVQLSETKQSKENEILQTTAAPNTKNLDNPIDEPHISSDVEVFEENSGPHKAKQEEEEAGEGEETPTDAEEPNNEDIETAAEPDPATEQGDETPTQTEDEAAPAAEVETATEAANNDETASAEAGNDEGTAAEEETTPNAAGEAAGNDEAEMPNDEPAKAEENDQPDLTKVSPTTDMAKKEVSCFACTSNEDVKCASAATKEIKCPKANEGDAGKHNGCYTLYQVGTNTSMRGCVDDLAEGGLKYCLTNEKLCNLCYSNSCNDKPAPSKATILQFNIYTLVILNISSLAAIKCASLKYSKF